MKLIIFFTFLALAEIISANTQNHTVRETCIGLLGTVAEMQRLMNDTHFIKGGFKKTIGAVWPQPQEIQTGEKFFALLPKRFSFQATDSTCDILESAIDRYRHLIFNPVRLNRGEDVGDSLSEAWSNQDGYSGVMDKLEVTLNAPCEGLWPSADMDEKYELKINSEDNQITSVLSSNSIWGILRGLETFSQLVYIASDGTFLVNSTTIIDFPRFPYRGVLLDTSSHYLTKRVLYNTLEAMAQNKFNVFHWHIVDNPSFPYRSELFPELSDQGAYNGVSHVYSMQDITDIIEFARIRGIRVIPEFDTPGHTRSWGIAASQLLTTCYKNISGVLKPDGLGPIDPSKDTTYIFLKELFQEVTYLFPDSAFHLGGDEVNHDCWKSNPDILKFMEKMDFGTDFTKLEAYHLQKLQEILDSFQKNISYIITEDILSTTVELKTDILVQVWKTPYIQTLNEVTQRGYQVILSSCWYLNYIVFGTDWNNFYNCDPQGFEGSDAQKELVLGGEVCVWGEYIDGTNLDLILWPRASAPAERLWSAASVNDPKLAAQRLEEHRCRMLMRGINAQPQNGPSFCPVDVNM